MSTSLYITSVLERANYLAAHGVYVIPEDRKSRIPRWSNWADLATVDTRQVRAWWSRGLWGIGVVPGPSNLLVLDVDRKGHLDGLASLRSLQDTHGPLPSTLRVRSPSGGRHLYYRLTEPPAGMTWRARLTGHDGIEIKTGSRKISNTPGLHRVKGWEYLANLPEAPSWLLSLAWRPEAPEPGPSLYIPVQETQWGRDEKAKALGTLALATHPGRNEALYKSAARIYSLIARGYLLQYPDPSEEIAYIAENIGLPSDEVRSTIQSARKAGAKSTLAPRGAL